MMRVTESTAGGSTLMAALRNAGSPGKVQATRNVGDGPLHEGLARPTERTSCRPGKPSLIRQPSVAGCRVSGCDHSSGRPDNQDRMLGTAANLLNVPA